MIDRVLIPGSEWLYFKLYTGMKSADIILADTIRPLTDMLLKNKAIDEWFFIRYMDPRFHLRFRMKIAKEGSFDDVMRAFHRAFHPLVENGLVINVVMDCYKREVERYGENSMELSEEVFSADSVAIADIVARLRATGDSDESRWLLGMNLVDDTLSAAGFDMAAKMQFIEMVDGAFRKEFMITSSNHAKPLNSKYRDHRKNLESTMGHTGIYEQYEDILNARKERLSGIFDRLRLSGGHSLDELLPSYTHMTINRLFRSRNRQCEMVVYYFMNKYYASYVARENYGVK